MSINGPHNTRRPARGMTVLELAVVILLAIALITASIAMVGAIFRADLRTDADKIVAAVRYLYNLAVINNRAYRLVIDQSEGTYWGEEFDDGEDGPCSQFLLQIDDPRELSKKKRSTSGGREEKSDEGEQPLGSFAAVKNHLIKKRSISKRIRFMGVLSEGQQERVRDAQVAIHFFPSGYVEHAFIYMGDGQEEGDVFTVETKPLLGSGRLFREELAEREFYVNDKR